MKIFTALAGLIFSGWIMATPLNNIVVFGDSLSDNGNFYRYWDGFMPVSPPYYKGRFTNGPVWIELLANFYYPEDANEHLEDIAFGGAGVLGEGEKPDDLVFTLQKEIKDYFEKHNQKADEQSLYVVWIGANNYFANLEEPEDTLNRVLSGIRSSLANLASKGAKHFLVLNLPDLGRIPLAHSDGSDPHLLTYYSEQHNQRLAQEIQNLQVEFPDVDWIYLEVDKILGDVFTAPEKYGFTNITDTCYEAAIDEPSSRNILRMVSRIKPKNTADACTGYLFFDYVHPTGPAHEIMAEKTKEILAEAGIEFH